MEMMVADNKFRVELWFGKRKTIASVKTIVSHVNNMIIGVSKGFQYKLRFAYAHFPVNVKVEKGSLEIRNFLGEKVVRKVQIPDGVNVAQTDPAKVKDELVLTGNDVEVISHTAATIHQTCLVKRKDIRKFLDGIYVQKKGPISDE